jgi:aldose 1-epimerase
MSTSTPPSGMQFTLALGSTEAVVTEVGAGLRRFTVRGIDVLDGYAADEMCSGARGHTFIPWPNRISRGRYSFDGREQQLPLTEPAAGNAIHGLTRWANWSLAHHNPCSVRMQHVLHPRPGYPFTLRCHLTYRLTAGALRVETRTTNIGAQPCPYATGAHPYLRLGEGPVDDLTVDVPAAIYFPTDERGIPTGRLSVEDTDRDLRGGRRLGSRVLDTAYTDLSTADDGSSAVTVRADDGAEVQLWMDAAYRYVELFTGDTLPEAGRRRRGLGVEPMTAAPDAFNSGDGLLTLEPGQSHDAAWELRCNWA